MKHIFVTNVVCRASANLLRIIPFGALIIMSPIVNAEEADVSALHKSQKESVQKEQGKVVLSLKYPKAVNRYPENLDAHIEFISTDDDDDTAEIVAIRVVEKDVPYFDEWDFALTEKPIGSCNMIYKLTEVKGLKICNYYDDENLSRFRSRVYSVTGIGYTFRSVVRDARGKILRESETHPSTDYKFKITEKFYKFLKETLEDEVICDEENVWGP